MSAQHTPGPWHVVRYGDRTSLVICTDEAGNQRIAFMATPARRDLSARSAKWRELVANANLSAAAPDLLEALEWIASNYENGDLNHVDFRVQAKHLADAAIARAKGGAA